MVTPSMAVLCLLSAGGAIQIGRCITIRNRVKHRFTIDEVKAIKTLLF
jgi:hypothetical protein